MVLCIVQDTLEMHTIHMNKTQSPSSSLRTQRGSAIIEFLVTALPVLLLSLGATETARWYTHKQHIRYALLEAQRVASVTHAKPEQFIAAFEEALKPLFAPAGMHKSTEVRRDAYLAAVSQKTGMTPWRISITSPTAEHFNDFQRDDLEIAQRTGLAAINNNYQLEQHQEKSIGLHSQQSIYEANILSVQLIYPYKPLVSGVSSLMKHLSNSGNSKLKQSYYANGYLPLELTAHLAMQSHPVLWPNDPRSKVVWHGQTIESDKPIANATEDFGDNDPCAGLWCPELSHQRLNNASSGDSNTSSSSTVESNTEHAPYEPPKSSVNTDSNTINDTENSWAPDSSSSTELDDPLCETSLCCN